MPTPSPVAHTVVCVLPLVWAALAGGEIDRGRGLVFARHLPDLSPARIISVCQTLLPVAGGLTSGQLEDRVRRMILEIDPTFYEGRYRKALRDRKVVHYLDGDGAAVVTASGLAAEEAARAMRRVDVVARAPPKPARPYRDIFTLTDPPDPDDPPPF